VFLDPPLIVEFVFDAVFRLPPLIVEQLPDAELLFPILTVLPAPVPGSIALVPPAPVAPLGPVDH